MWPTYWVFIWKDRSSVKIRKEHITWNRFKNWPMYVQWQTKPHQWHKWFNIFWFYIFWQGISTLRETYGKLDNVSIVTLAPEKSNALDVIEELTKSNITVSLGHSVANFTEGEAAIERGSNLITHLFNAMLPVSLGIRSERNIHCLC